MDRRAKGFSQGQRIKVAVARALIHDPSNLVLDEPTNGLDVMAIRNLREILRDLKLQGRCILFSSHVMQEVAALCDRVVILGQGRVLAEGPLEALRSRLGAASLEEAFLKVLGEAEAQAEGEAPARLSSMRALLTVFCKEFLENLRDRRTLFSALLFGPLFGPDSVRRHGVENAQSERAGIGRAAARRPSREASTRPIWCASSTSQGVKLAFTSWSESDARDAVKRGAATVVLIVPRRIRAALHGGVARARVPGRRQLRFANSQERGSAARAGRGPTATASRSCGRKSAA